MQAQVDENTQRLPFLPSEAVAIGSIIEEREREAAAKRQGGRPPKTGGNLPPVSETGKTRDKVAAALGMSGRSYEKAKAVVDSPTHGEGKTGWPVSHLETSERGIGHPGAILSPPWG